ncbi:MAG: sulfite exporter TauE/SafE family protein [Synergistaceae bacterium]|nr:sulfite exporter TauE/SafE family protein [Synergistaceae bacterium]
MEFTNYLPLLLVTATGVAAGFLNVLAGGGSLLSLPMLNFIGLDLGIANATNRVAILCQNLSAMGLYQKRGEIKWREVWAYALPAVAGAIIGTLTAIYIPPKAFRIIAAISISFMGILLVAKPKMWDNPDGLPLPPAGRAAALFGTGLYGGFLQAGVGFFLIWAIVGGCKKNLKEANILKIVVVAIYTMASLLLFASFGMVNWTAAVALAIGNMIGGNLGARFNLKGDKKWLRWILTIAVIVSAVKIFFDVFR